MQDRLARAKDVRGALALVERAEAPYGIVYSTDAKLANKLKRLQCSLQIAINQLFIPFLL